jgi:hypothetical protein
MATPMRFDTLGLILSLGVVASVSAQEQVSRPAGMMRMQLPAQTTNAVSQTFQPFSADLRLAMTGQLTDAATPATADALYVWDASAQVWQGLYHGSVGGWQDIDEEGDFFDTFTLAQGVGLHVVNKQTFAQSLFLRGWVVFDGGQAVTLPPGLSLIGPTAFAPSGINSSSLAADGALGASTESAADQVTDLHFNTIAWLLANTNSMHHLKWLQAGTTNTLSTITLTPGEGYWYRRDGLSAPLTWQQPIAYPDLFLSSTGTPAVTSIAVDDIAHTATLSIRASGAPGETLDIYFQDLALGEAFSSTSEWSVAAQNIATLGQTSISWVDDPSGGRPDPDAVFARVYTVGRAHIDTDGDGIPDVRETYLDGTDPLDQSQPPQAPAFASNPLLVRGAKTGVAYVNSIAASATDGNNDPLTFTLVSGPAWLAMSPGGVLSGTPTLEHLGDQTAVVSVSDGNGGVASTTLLLSVTSPGLFTFPFTENFEAPVVSGYVQGQSPPAWIKATAGYGANQQGLVNKNGGAFAAPNPNKQGYAFRYTNSGLTTVQGVVGALESGRKYQVSFRAVKNGTSGGTFYRVQLVAVNSGAARTDVRTGASGITVLAETQGYAPTSGAWMSGSFSFTADPALVGAHLGKDVAVRLIGATTGAIMDDVKVHTDKMPDTDNDGLYDQWELLYLGLLNASGSGDAYSDADGDGLPLIMEMLAGTDPNAADTDGDGFNDLQEVLAASDPLNPNITPASLADADGDEMPDVWETKYGLNPQLKDAFLDPDLDGLANLYEFLGGSNPKVKDTDADGFDDWFEVVQAGSKPYLPDLAGSHQVLHSQTGISTTSRVGEWLHSGSSLHTVDRGGQATYTLNAPTSGVFMVEFLCSQFDPDATLPGFAINVSAGGTSLGRHIETLSFGAVTPVRRILPHRQAGPVTVTLDWHYRIGNGTLRIIEVRLVRLDGMDADESGTPDWLESRNTTHATASTPAEQSYVSPVCFEGTSMVDLASLSLSTSAGGGEVLPLQPGIENNWYANVPLDPTLPTDVVLFGETGGVIVSNQVEWAVWNLLQAPTNTVTIRRGDAMKLSAYPEAATNGVVTIDVAGITNFVADIDTPLVHLFDTEGTFTVAGDYNGVLSTQLTVHVVAADFAAGTPLWVNKSLLTQHPGVPSAVVVEADPRLVTTTAARPDGGTDITLTIDAPEPRRLVARLGGPDGPVLDAVTYQGFDLRSNSLDLTTIHTWADGSKLIRMTVKVTEVFAGMTVVVKNVGGDFWYADGSTQLTLTAADFDELGEASVYFITSPVKTGGVCHFLHVNYNGQHIGTR